LASQARQLALIYFVVRIKLWATDHLAELSLVTGKMRFALTTMKVDEQTTLGKHCAIITERKADRFQGISARLRDEALVPYDFLEILFRFL
jgi:hypothetical protein